MADALLDNSAMRDGLTDDEAKPMIDFGMALANDVGDKLEAHAKSPEFEAYYEDQRTAFVKIMTRIGWVAIYREKKGADWTVKTLKQINDYHQTLRGAEAPQLSPTIINAYAHQMDGLDKGAFVQDILNQLSPKDTHGEET